MTTSVYYIIAVLCTILWAFGFFTHLIGDYIHLLLIAAFVLILMNIVRQDTGASDEEKKPDTNENKNNQQLTN